MYLNFKIVAEDACEFCAKEKKDLKERGESGMLSVFPLFSIEIKDGLLVCGRCKNPVSTKLEIVEEEDY